MTNIIAPHVEGVLIITPIMHENENIYYQRTRGCAERTKYIVVVDGSQSTTIEGE